MPTLTETTSKNPRDYDIPLNERIVYDIIEDLIIPGYGKWKLYEKSFFTDKLKELEVDLTVATESFCSNLILALKKTAQAHNVEFNPKDIKKVYEFMIEDYTNCARKMCEIEGESVSYKIRNGLIDPLKYATVMFNRILINIDECIIRCSTAIKSVNSPEDILNKVNYTDAIYGEHDWVKLSEEQDKLIKSGKDLFSKESLLLNIKKLRTLKSRVLRIFNKHFGKDSIYAFANLHDACK